MKLSYALIYSFLTYGILNWGNTYETTLKPLFILQKKAVRIITFSKLDSCSSPLFKSLGLSFLILLYFNSRFLCTNLVTMCCLLHSIFFFTKVTSVHNYNTRFAAKHSYYLPYARTNYGKFYIRFQGPSAWNTIDDNVKLSSSISVFKKRLKDQYVERL